jgi:hypothetical protein
MKHLFAVLLLALATLCQAEVIQGKLVGVIDGDTIDVLDASMNKHRIRLAGIDAPERWQAFGQKSKESLSTLVFARQAGLRPIARTLQPAALPLSPRFSFRVLPGVGQFTPDVISAIMSLEGA